MTGSKCGESEYFHGQMCRRDVGMGSHGAKDFFRHFSSPKHWRQDVVYLGTPNRQQIYGTYGSVGKPTGRDSGAALY